LMSRHSTPCSPVRSNDERTILVVGYDSDKYA
jgi:hypothetical protein